MMIVFKILLLAVVLYVGYLFIKMCEKAKNGGI